MNTLKQQITLVFAIVAFSVLAPAICLAQQQIRTINATAMGTSTQLGKIVSIDLHIREYSKPEDQKILLQAFSEGGSDELTNALDKMSSKGRMAITGTIGYDVHYIRIFQNYDGSKTIRFVTDRPIRFGEAWGDTRSRDYSVSIIEIKIPASGKKATGTLLPAAKPRVNKKGELEIELYQNAWNLTNIRLHS
jgi:hypothetical protein